MISFFVMLLGLALSWAATLDPSREPDLELAIATVEELQASPSLYAHDELRIRSLALVVAIQFRESTFRNAAVGDGGQSFCAMQVHASSGGTRALLASPRECVAAGLALLRRSIALDRAHPVAAYARGPRYKTEEARSISDDRVRIAERLAHGLD